MTIKHRILKIASFVNRKTWFLDRFKDRLGLTSLMSRILTPSLEDSDVKDLEKNLNTHHIADQVKQSLDSGCMPTFWVLLTCSMGDLIACEPIARYLKHLAPKARVIWIVLRRFHEVIETNHNVDEIVDVETLTEGKMIVERKRAEGNKNNIIVDCHLDGDLDPVTHKVFSNPVNPQVYAQTYYRIGNLLETFCLAAGLPKLKDSPRFYIRDDVELPVAISHDAVVFHCRSAGAERNWDDMKWNQLADHLVRRGCSVIEVGIERVLKEQDGVIDFTGRRCIQQIARIISKAVLFIGVDSGFAHLANATKTRSIVLIGRFRNFNMYFPYSGDFSRSDDFLVLNAPNGQPCSGIDFQCVADAAASMLQAHR